MQRASKQGSCLCSSSEYWYHSSRSSISGCWFPRGAGNWKEVCGAGMQAESLRQWSILHCFPCKLEFDTFRGEAKTTRKVEIRVPISLHFPFSLPALCLQKGFLSQACYDKSSAETVQNSEQILFQCRRPRTCHGLRDIFHLLGHMEAQHLVREWPTLRAPLKPNDPWCSLPFQLLSSALKAHIPDATCHLPNQLWSRWSHRATERFQHSVRGSSSVLQMQEQAPLREKVGKETAAWVSHRVRLHWYSPWRVGGGCSCQYWSRLLPLQMKRRLRTPSPTHKSIPGCLIWIRWEKGLGFVPWSSQAMAYSRKPSQHACAEDELDTSEFVAEH